MFIARVLLQVPGAFITPHKSWCRRSCVDKGGRLLTFLVLLSIIALVPLAQASPVDPLWIHGIYDAGDHDDAVWILTDPSTGTSCARASMASLLSVTAESPHIVSISSPVPARSHHLRSPPH